MSLYQKIRITMTQIIIETIRMILYIQQMIQLQKNPNLRIKDMSRKTKEHSPLVM